jgi:UDP-2-acetamido-2,6-beta-L-arabino-hexul-4-ose reductase
MTNILVTGSGGFIGSHIVAALKHTHATKVVEFRRQNSLLQLRELLLTADVIVHLAGINRPIAVEEFEEGNTALTATICQYLLESRKRPLFLFASSAQAVLDNPYGRSKRQAEEAIQAFTKQTGSRSVIFRLTNVFGKWSRPNYNSVVATFCYNVARGLPLTISDNSKRIDLVYIDDVVLTMLEAIENPPPATISRFQEVPNTISITLGDLAAQLQEFRQHRSTLCLPCFSDDFTQRLYATYVSYLEPSDFVYDLGKREDERGTLAEFLKSKQFGQIFVSRTKPGVTRGNHFHHTKAEKFLVLEGDAVIRLRRFGATQMVEHCVGGRDFRVVDIPPGYTHSIQNIGPTELIVLFWSSQIFDSKRPDTIMEPVLVND